MISCSTLYGHLGGYGHEGGKYDSAEKMLRALGWVYDIKRDAWFPPAEAIEPKVAA